MKMRKLTLLVALIGSLGVTRSQGQGFNSGSDGSYGPLNITSNTTLNMPSNGVFHCTTITIAAGTALRFNRNPLNTPVYLLATGNVTIAGTIDVSGTGAVNAVPTGGAGGPGGFDGGKPGFGASVPPGAGYGPGGGKGGLYADVANAAGGGSYGSAGGGGSTNKGAVYGSPLLIPMAGGSGGGGTDGSPGTGGGGGGGAVLIASNTRIDLPASGRIFAQGNYSPDSYYNAGSGGAIRLIAPIVAGTGQLHVTSNSPYSGAGRIRVDSIDRTSLQLSFNPAANTTVGSTMFVFPTPIPRLDIIEAADTVIPEGTPNPVYIQLPFGSTTNRTVTVQARDFGSVVLIRVALTPDSGRPTYYDDTIDNAAANPAQKVINVVVPVNVQVHVGVWTR